MNDEPLISVRDLQTRFFTEEGVVRAVDGISFDVYEGEIVGLVGESGAGKSVAVRSVMRLIEEPGEIVGGEIRFEDEVLYTDGDHEASRDEMLSNGEIRERIRGREIAIIFQDPMESLNPVFTIGGQLREVIEINRDVDSDAAREEAIDILRKVGIPEPENRYSDYPHEFSGGMRQRVLIAMALACEPSVIVADEPTTALDVTVEGQILELVADLQDEFETSFLWVTHDMGVVAEVCDRVNVMYLGEIVEQSAVDDLFYDTQHPYTKALLDSIPRPDRTVEELDPIEGVMPEAIDPPTGCRFHTRCPDAREVCREVQPSVAEVKPDHGAACLKHETVFGVEYEASEPLDVNVGSGVGAGMVDAGDSTRGNAGGDRDD